MARIFLPVLFIVILLSVSCQTAGLPLAPAYPWAGCGPGSFVLYQMVMPDGRTVQEKQVVIEVKPGQVLVESLALGDNGWEHRGKMIVPLNAPRRPPSDAVGVNHEQLVIGGRIARCNVFESQGVRVWMSEDVPGGLVKRLSDNTVILEVVDFRKK